MTVRRVVLGLVLAAGGVVATASPALAAQEWDVVAPPPGERVTGETGLVVAVDAYPVAQVDAVEVRLVRDGEPAGDPVALEHREGPTSGGRSVWEGTWSPLASWAHGGGVAPNGRYRVEARARSRLGEWERTTRWRGHGVRVDAPPPAPRLEAALRDARGGTVDLRWSAAAVPDLRAYVVERARDGAEPEVVARTGDPAATGSTDTPPAGGRWAYRVVVVRAGASGGDRAAASEWRVVEVAEAVPERGRRLHEPGGSGHAGGAGSGASGGASGTGDGAGGPEGTGSDRAQDPPAVPAPRLGRPQPAEPPRGSGAAAGPATPPDDGFEMVLDYGRLPSRAATGPGDRPAAADAGGRPPSTAAGDGPGTAGAAAGEPLSAGGAVPDEGPARVAAGLLLFVVGGHLLRLARAP